MQIRQLLPSVNRRGERFGGCLIKCGLDQNSQVYLGWELGTDKHEVALFMQ